MIQSHDRSGYIGASDVQYVIGNWKTKTWEKWWLQKLGINRDHFDNRHTLAGTNWEHRILESLGLPDLELDKQIIIEDLRLRVNLDGNTATRIKECKTYSVDGASRDIMLLKSHRSPPKYERQTHVQVFGARAAGMEIEGADIVAYGLEEADYDNFLRDIDPLRRQEIPVEYDRKWTETVYLPKHLILCDCLKRGVFPDV
jgi:hypothetical protein